MGLTDLAVKKTYLKRSSTTLILQWKELLDLQLLYQDEVVGIYNTNLSKPSVIKYFNSLNAKCAYACMQHNHYFMHYLDIAC